MWILWWRWSQSFQSLQNFETSPGPGKKAMTTTSVQSIWLLLLDDTLWNPIARCTKCKNVRYARIAWEILRRNFIQSKLSTNWSPRKDQGATTGLLCVLQNGSPSFHSFLDTMLTQNTWCWWAGGVPWCHHFVGSNPHGRYHFVGVPIPFCREVGWAPYTLVGPTSRGEFQGGWKLDVFLNDFQGPSRTIQNKQSVYKMEGRHHIHKHDPRWHFPFKMVGLGPPINQILCFFCAVGALHFVERDLLIHTQHHFIWEQDHMPVSGTSIL